MDDNGGPKNGGTGPIISNTSTRTGSTPFQAPTQPDVPAWMFARNNSVHAPVFGQPSDRQSASHKRHSMPSSFSEAADSQSPFAKIRASIAANNAKSQAKASQPSSQPLSCAPGAQDTLNDDQALALLLNNETVARMLQNGFNTRVEEHQQKVERSYNQRLLELEEYTRSWRDNTKELWLAVSEGTLNPNKDHQETLSWKGPQLAGHGFNPEHPIAPQEIVEKEFDKDGTVACINVKNPSISVKNPGTSVKNPKNPSTSHSDPHFNLLNWTKSKGCGSKNFETFADHLAAPLKKGSGRLIFRHETKFGTIKYRTMTSIDNIVKLHRTDVVIELTPSNVALCGKAFCYLKNTHDRLFNQANAHCGKSVSPDEVSFLVDRFSSEPTKRFIDVLRLYNGNLKVIPDLFAVNINVSTILKRLLIARPRYAIDGSISGARFFDVGRGVYTTWQESDEDIILFEDKVSFLQLAMLLCFSINTGLVPVSLGASTPVLSGTSSDAGFKLTGLRSDQVSHQPSAGIVPNPTQGGPSQEGITDIKGSANDSTSMSFLSPGNGSAFENPQNGEPEQSDEDSTTIRGLFSTDKTQKDPGLEQKRTQVPSSLPPAQPSLFQRTLDLSKGLKELEDDARRDGFRPQAHSQWLAIGGEPQDIRSPSPKRQQERIADILSQAHVVEEEVLPSGPNHPGIDGSLSKDTEKSDLIVLDERPKNVTFRCGRKRPFPAADEKVQTAKRPKILKAEPSTVSDRQLPQSYPRDRPPGAPKPPLGSAVPPDRRDKEHLGQPAASPAVSQAGTEEMEPLATSNSKQWLRSETMARRTKELNELQEQLRQLGCRIEADFDQANRSTIGGNIETSGKLQVDGAPGRTPASSEVTASQQLRENLRRIGCRFQEDIDKADGSNAGGEVAKVERLQKSIEPESIINDQRQMATAPPDLFSAAHLPSFGVPDQTNVSSGDSNLFSTGQEPATDPQKTLTGQNENTPVEGEEVFKWSDSPAREAAKLGRRARTLRRG